MSGPIDVTSERPAFLSGVYAEPYTVRNDGLVDLYLGIDSSLTVLTRDFTLTPKSTMTWDGKSQLWAITNANEVGRAEIMPNGNMAFAPGPDVVIANATAVTLIDGTFSPTAGGTPGANMVLFDDDVSKYSSIAVRVGDESGAASTDISSISLQWFIGGLQVGEQSPRFTSTGRLEYTAPILGSRLRVVLTNGSLSAMNYAVAINGVTGVLPRSYLHIPGNTSAIIGGTFSTRQGAERAKFFGFRATASAAGTVAVLFPHYAGPARIGRMANGTLAATANLSLSLAGSNDSVFLQRGVTAGVNESLNMPVTLPEYPLWFQFPNSTLGSGVEASIIYE